MPIKFKCPCGQTLSVSSKLAGKQGKCPKCQKAIKIPSPKGRATSSSGKAAPAGPKPGKVKASKHASAPSPAVGGALDSLLDDAGLIQKSGPTCPDCMTDIRPGTVICTNCGYNFESGEKLTGFDAKHEGPEFDNLYLEEASKNMERDLVMQSRRDKSEMPWWVIASFLIGVLTLCAAGIIIVDGKFGTPDPEDTFIGKIQRWPVFTTLGLTSLITGIAISVFSHLSIVIFGFGKSVQQGLLCFFLPVVYSVVYGIMNWVENKAPVKAIIMASVFIGLGVYLIVQGGGFNLVFDAFR
ncbi:MAG: hypothetical protein AB8B50_17710 [Pirellulaceae bacterium]